MKQQTNEENISQDNDSNERSPIQKVLATLKSSKELVDSRTVENSMFNQLIIQQFKLNHGLFLDGCRIELSKQDVLIEDGELNISLYDQPFVNTSINDRNSYGNLLRFNSDNDVELDGSLRPSDICINFPVAEITFTSDLSESFSNFTNDDEGKLYEMYGHLLPRKILIGDEIQPGVANFKEKLTLENWIKYSRYVRWVREFQLFQGLIVDQNFELKTCKENAFDLINSPNIESSGKFCLEIVKPTTILEEILINNNIFSTNNNKEISSFPFIKVSDDPSYQDYVHFLVKCERYKISLNRNNIKPSEKLNEVIEKALESTKPLTCLQEVFDKYGHFIPLNILLGKSLRNTTTNSSNISERIDLVSPIYESLKSYLTNYSVECLSTQNGDIIEENDLFDWIHNVNNDLEIIEFNNIIPLYNILEVEQTKRINTILNKQDKFKIIMTGSIDLKDSDITKQIIINDIFITFGSYEINEFSATIETLKNTNISIGECYIIWMIIGNPSELSVFYPNNREIQADFTKESIILKRNDSSYSIKTSYQLSQGYEISIKCFKTINIELTGWSKNCVYLNISNSKPQLEQSNKQYPIKGDRKKNELKVTNKSLEGHLDLSDFVNLEKLDCSTNKLTSLDISKNEKLTEIDCSQNNLISLDLSNCLNIKSVTANYNQLNDLKLSAANNETLEYINLLDNSFSQNINCFGHLVNLKQLLIGNTDENRIKQGIYNRFYGSLKSLKLIIKLENLSINDTDIDSGLEYLPDSITIFRCSANKRPEAKVIKIYEQLKTYTMGPSDTFQGRYNLKAWKKNWKLIKENETLQNQIKQIEKLTSDAKLMELENEKNSLQEKEKELEKKNNQLGIELTNLEQETNNLKQMVEELNAKLKQKEDVHKQTEQQIKEKEKKIGSLITVNLVEKEGLKEEIKALKESLTANENDMRESEKQLEEKNKELKIKEDKATNLKNERDKIISSLSEINVKKAKLNSLEKKLKHEKLFSKTSTSDLRKKMDDLKKDLKSSQSKKEELEAKAREIDNELEEVRRNKEALQNEQIRQQVHIEKLQKDKENLQYDFENQKDNLKEKEKLINELQQQNEEKIAALNNKIKSKDEFIDNIKQQCEEQTTALNNEIKNKEEFIDKIKQQNEKQTTVLNNEIKNKEGIIDKIKQQNEEQTVTFNNVIKNKEELINELKQQNEKEIADLNNEIKNKKELIDKIEQQNEEQTTAFNNEIRNKEELINELKQQNEKKVTELNNEIKNKEEFIDKIKKQNEEQTTAFNNEIRNKEELINELKQQNEKKVTDLNNEIKNKEEFIDKIEKQNEEQTTAFNNEIKNKEELIDKLNEETKKYQNSQENFKKEISALLPQIQIQQTGLRELVNNVDKEHDLNRRGRILVDDMLEKQRNVIQTDDNSASKELEKIRQKLIDLYDITEEKIHDILYKQAEKTKLEMQLKSLID
ncbi:unnamed protein product [Rhizophagus irregularis]|nr:unnamed protein product [Rhizophagus irregularis]